ncbi:sigma-54 dependent transcriptional regulator [Roseobacter sp. HKCCA0434]|uniref:sigma-54-dependent transcriptional regulator n=1 Tax=Roseobacter sp. HKCCA0434 TaxID=3079297 RepID=UPI002905D5B7|nr:sigma-54 dependent transcriptional regulator [Roseobacter sp. HKCCA0434]
MTDQTDALPVTIIDDEEDMRASIAQFLDLSGFAPQSFEEAAPALDAIDEDYPGVVISDVRMPGMDGLELLAELQRKDRDLPVIMITGHGDVAMAVEAMRAGAYDFIEKPFDPERLSDLVRRAATQRRLTIDNRLLRRELADGTVLLRRIMGDSPAVERLRATIMDYAHADAPVMIKGERGSGRSLAARALHAAGPQAGHPFLTLNCAAEPASHIEERVFSPDRSGNPPLLIAAGQGMVVFENVSALPARLQTRLGQTLSDGKMSDGAPIRCRIATIADEKVGEEVASGQFSPGLFYVLSALEIVTPPLREMGQDVLKLFEHYVDRFAQDYDTPRPDMSAEDAASLLAHDWPGNQRQLINIAERFVLRARQGTPTVRVVLGEEPAPEPSDARAAESGARPLKDHVEAFERLQIEAALRRHHGAIAPVMEELALPRRTLNEKMAKYGISRTDFV